MATYAQNSCTLSTVTDVQSIYTYHLLAPSTTVITNNMAPKDATIDNPGNPPGASSITITYLGDDYVWTISEPGINIQTNDIGTLYYIECTLFSDNTFDWGPIMTSSSYEAAKQAFNKATIVSNLVGDSPQHFWWLTSQEGSHPAGAYVTYVSQESFKSNPNNQPNLLLQSEGISLRNGLTTKAQMTSTGLEVLEGGIKGGQAGSNGFIYLSTIDYPKGNEGITINGHAPEGNGPAWRAIIGTKFAVDSDGNLYANSVDISGKIIATEGQIGGWNIGTDTNKSLFYGNQVPGAATNNLVMSSSSAENTIPIAGSDINKHWFLSAGTKFGVDTEGNLYANSAHLSNAEVEGAITATSLIIGSGSNVYDGEAAINISGYSIEIISDSTGVVDAVNTTYLYPYLYHNGERIEYFLSTDITVDSSKTYYTRSGTVGNYTYTIVSNPSGNPSENQYYEHIDYSHFIWYQDNQTIGTEGDINNYGRYLATYGHSYRVTYDFDDGAVQGGSTIQTRTVDPSKYITKTSDVGINIHPEVQTNTTIMQLNNDGLNVVQNGISIAQYGTTARVGVNNSSRFLMNVDSLQAYDENNNKYFEVNANGLSWGSNTNVSATQIIANSEGLSLVPDAGGNKVLISTGQGSTYTIAGTYIIGKVNNVDTVFAKFTANGATMQAENGTQIAHLGYGEGRSTSGTAVAPYYTLGRRANNSVIGNYSVAEGENITASAKYAHAEGVGTQAGGYATHAEGEGAIAWNMASHAEGLNTHAKSDYSHAEGQECTSLGAASHTEGRRCETKAPYAHAQTYKTIAASICQTALGQCNIEDANNTYAVIIGNGNGISGDPNERSNALTVDWNGNTTIAGTLTQSSDRQLKNHQSYLSTDAIDFIQNLKPAYFKKDNQFHVGFYAQDVEEIDPWNCMVGEMNGYKTLGYTELIAPLVTYCQHLEERIKQLEGK